MDAAVEQKILKSLLHQIDNPRAPVISPRSSKLLLWVAFIAIATILLLFSKQIGPWLSAAGFLLLGITYSRAWYKTAAGAGWRVVIPHLNKETIESRLKELES